MISSKIREDRLIRMSHIMSEATPAYAGGDGVKITKLHDMQKGDTCNSAHLSLPNHIGSHVDAQSHFVQGGKDIADYQLSDWFFSNPVLIDIAIAPGQLLGINDFEKALGDETDLDLLLIRTGMEQKRKEDIFWKSAPGYDECLAEYLKDRFPSIKAIGMDSISLSSLQHKEMGRESHRAFLGRDIRIFEDLALADIPAGRSLEMVIALPFLFENADGAPCNVIGFLS